MSHTVASLLAVSLILWIIVIGFAISRRLLPAIPAEARLLVIVAAGIAAQALVGFLVALIPWDRKTMSIFLLALPLLPSTLVIHRFRDVLFRELTDSRVALAVWVLTSVLALSVTYQHVRKPGKLQDGPYVFKTWSLPVKIQAIALDYPLDNALPAIVSEYLIRGIPFRSEHPVLPGQEVSNRPILLSLATVPLRSLLGPTETYISPLPRFTYVGTDWPNTESLLTDETFRQFLVVAIVLNATIALAFAGLLRAFQVKASLLFLLTFVALSPYVLLHTFFTWPKNLAAFFVITSWLLLRKPGCHPWLAGVMIALGYWAHPYAILFILASGVYVTWACFRKDISLPGAVGFVAAVTIVVAPWLVWTTWILGIHSDILQQNFQLSGTLFEQLWVRVNNFYHLLLPSPLGLPAPTGRQFLSGFLHTLASPLGIVFLPFLPLALIRMWEQEIRMLLLLVVVPACGIVALFSVSAVPMAHGWQTVWPVLAALTLAEIQQRWGSRLTAGLCITQLAMNLAFLIFWGSEVFK